MKNKSNKNARGFEMSNCFHCFKEFTEDKAVETMFCSKKCSDEWNEMKKDWIIPKKEDLK